MKKLILIMIIISLLSCTKEINSPVVENPCALEPCETISKANLDEYIEMWKQIVHEAYTNPEIFKTAPHNTQISKVDTTVASDPKKWAPTWRVYLNKYRQ